MTEAITTTDPAISGAPRSRGDAIADLVALVDRSAGRGAYWRQALLVLGQFFRSPYAAVSVRFAAEVTEHEWCAEGVDPAFWKSPTQAVLTESLREYRAVGRLFRARATDVSIAVIAAPVRGPGGRAVGALALVVPCATVQQARGQQVVLESLVSHASCCAARFEISAAPAAAAPDAAAARQLARVGRFESPTELAFAITNSLRNQTSCDQIALGVASGGRVEILSISGYEEVNDRSPGVAELRAAMEECVDAGVRIVYPTDAARSKNDDPPVDWRLHRQWHDRSASGCVASLPFVPATGPTLVLSLRRSSREPFGREELDRVEKLVEPYAAAFDLVRRAGRSLKDHARDSAEAFRRSFEGDEARRRRRIAWTLAAGAALLLFGRLPYRIHASAVLRPADVRQLAAPADAVLAEVKVVPGDVVHRGDLLARFDVRDLEVQRDQLRAELSMHRLAVGRAQREGAAVEIEMARAQARMTETKLRGLERRLEAATLRAPFDGVVLSGDVRERVGQVLRQGESVIEVAATGRWRVELSMPDHVAGDVATGMTGEFATNARPDRAEPLQLVHVRPHVESANGQSSLVAEAEVQLDEPWARSGMEGVATIRGPWRSIPWLALHRLGDWLRLRFLL